MGEPIAISSPLWWKLLRYSQTWPMVSTKAAQVPQIIEILDWYRRR